MGARDRISSKLASDTESSLNHHRHGFAGKSPRAFASHERGEAVGYNAAGFEVGIKTLLPEEAERLGIVPFGDGGAEQAEAQKPKIYTHGPFARELAEKYVVPCEGWRQAGPDERRQLAGRALDVLKEYGFVVLERLFPAETVEPLEAAAARFLNTAQDGFVPQPLRASRTEGHLPYSAPWSSDWLIKNDLILEVAAGYVRNNLAAGRNQEEQQWAVVQWIASQTSGSDQGDLLDGISGPEWAPKPGPLLDEPPEGCSDVGSRDEQGAFFARITCIKTPAGSPSQKQHRDIILPGPGGQLTVQVALTPLQANNGPLGFSPGSHRMKTPEHEVVACPPLGSVVLYDSFCEHHGIENESDQDRYVMYYQFESRGLFSGYSATHFGPESGRHQYAFRAAVDPQLRKWVECLELERAGSTCTVPSLAAADAATKSPKAESSSLPTGISSYTDKSTFNAALSACVDAGQWQRALLLLHEMRAAELRPDIANLKNVIEACEKGGQWQQVLPLLDEVKGAIYDQQQ